MTEPLDLNKVAEHLRVFAAERDWEQFHTPKNLSMALAGEVGELLEIFQWLTPGESGDVDGQVLQHVGEELVDILQYVVRIADLLEIDLNDAFWAKFEENAARYPAERGAGECREAVATGLSLSIGPGHTGILSDDLTICLLDADSTSMEPHLNRSFAGEI